MKKNYISTALITVASLYLAGCASITTGTKQTISVKTTPITDATCSLENNKGKWYINRTPGTVVIHRSFNDLAINCEKKGYFGHKNVGSNTKAIAFGNVVFGGVIGAGVDMANGAAYHYPAEVDVTMSKAKA